MVPFRRVRAGEAVGGVLRGRGRQGEDGREGRSPRCPLMVSIFSLEGKHRTAVRLLRQHQWGQEAMQQGLPGSGRCRWPAQQGAAVHLHSRAPGSRAQESGSDSPVAAGSRASVPGTSQ